MKKIILLLSMMAFSSAGADYVKVEAKITDDKYSSKTQSIVASRGKTYSAGQFVSVGLGHVVYIEDNAPVKPDYGFIDVAGRHNINKNTHVSGSLQRYDDSAMTYDLTLQYTADEYKYAFGAFTERGRIDSYAGLSKGLFGVLYGVSADYMVTQQWSVTGVYYTMAVDDGNTLSGQVAQVVYSPEAVQGLYFKLRAKLRTADFNPPEYFAPDQLDRYDARIGYVTAIGDDWKFRAEAGPARQTINGIQEPGFGYKVELNGWINPSWKFGISTASVTDKGDESYYYNWSSVNLSYYW